MLGVFVVLEVLLVLLSGKAWVGLAWPLVILGALPVAVLVTHLGTRRGSSDVRAPLQRLGLRARSWLALAWSGGLLFVLPTALGPLLAGPLPYWLAVLVNTLLTGLASGVLCAWSAPSRPMRHAIGATLTAGGVVLLLAVFETKPELAVGAVLYLAYAPLLIAGCWLASRAWGARAAG